MFGIKQYLYGMPERKEKKEDGKLGWHDIGLYGGGLYFLGLWGLPLAWGIDKLYHYSKDKMVYPIRDIRYSMEPEFKQIREMDLGNHYFNEIEAFMAAWKPGAGFQQVKLPTQNVGVVSGPDPLIEKLKQRLNN